MRGFSEKITCPSLTYEVSGCLKSYVRKMEKLSELTLLRFWLNPTLPSLHGVSVEIMLIVPLSWNLPEVEFPVEPAPGHITGSYILKTFIWDNINHRTHDSFPNQSSINQPTNQPINQIINQSTIRPINPSFGQPTNLSINQPTDRFDRSTYQ